MKKLLALSLLFCLLSETGQAQFTRYIVRFRHKGDNPYSLSNPSAYLSARAIARRTRYGIAIDSTDLPVTPRFIDSVRAAGTVTVLNTSKWLNSITIQTTDAAALTKINALPFVVSATGIAARTTAAGSGKAEGTESIASMQSRTAADFFSYGSSSNQIRMHNGQFLHNIGLRGQNMFIGMLDGGYNSYLTLRAFDSARANGQILDTWDFVVRNASVNEDDAHGMNCFSIIAANIPGSFVGSAPKASFYLYRTEDGASEFPIEEHNWVCGVERIDSAGGDLVSSSLGYSEGMGIPPATPYPALDHTYAEMNGNTTIAAIGADLGAKKGLLIANAMGNQGNESFKRLSTPADADSVLAVGAVNSAGAPAPFTSLGPSSDGQVKPDVSSLGVGTTLQTTSNTVGAGNGTSFSTPNILGLAACLWQGFPEVNNMRIITTLRRASSRFTNPNDTVGYGIPDMKKATLILLSELSTASGNINNCKATLNFSSKDIAGMKYEIERKTAAQSNYVKVGEVAATGSLFDTRSRSFSDTLIQVAPGSVSYRIRQVIDTAAASFSADYIDTVNLSLSNSCVTSVGSINDPMNDWQLLPNPTGGQLQLKLNMTAPIPQLTIRISNVKGQQVLAQKQSKPSGTTTYSLSLHHLAKGEYYVTLLNGSKAIGSKKLVKL